MRYKLSIEISDAKRVTGLIMEGKSISLPNSQKQEIRNKQVY